MGGCRPEPGEKISLLRPAFFAMVTSYSLGSFNENFFKEAAMLIAVAQGKAYLQGYATILFTLPFLLFAAPAGWLADRFPKRRVMIAAKLVEVFAMSLGAIGLYTNNWDLVLFMAIIMSFQATTFSPSINGSIPEIFPPDYVTRANAVLKVSTMACILVGVAVAGIALGGGETATGKSSPGRLTVTLVAVIVTLFGFISSLGVPSCPAASPGEKFPWDGPASTVRNLFRLREDTLFAFIIITDVFIYTVGSLQIQVINKLGVKQFGYNETITGLMVVAELVGFGIGGLASSIFARGERWYRVLAPGCYMMAIFTGTIAAVPIFSNVHKLWVIFLLLAGTGASGGLLLIPCESFVQIRPEPHRKGAVIASVNFAIFSGILLSGPVANILNANLRPTAGFGVIGVVSLLYGIFLTSFFRVRKWI
jgi:acyl-[acyl-carrier-protein]-phospholipid O-acyltransferase/long-chain-fatty-acid--[acyl-carrier-protein] ligase